MSKTKNGLLLVGVFCIISLMLVVTGAQGAVIPLDGSGWAVVVSPSSAGVSIPYYVVTDSAVVMQLDKTYNDPPEGGFFRPIVIEFQKISSNATSNIIIGDEYIVNNTGTEWFDFHMHLMVDVLEPQAGFNSDIFPDGGQLESVYYSMNYGYNGLPVQLNFVDTNGSGVPASPPGDDVFWPGYMSGQIVIATNPDMEVGARFGLKEVPTVPEPATICLLVGGTFIAIRGKRSTSRKNA